MNESTLRIEGEDTVYVNFSGSARVRLVAFFKDKKSAVKKVLYADLFMPGGKHTMLRADFEAAFAMERPRPDKFGVWSVPAAQHVDTDTCDLPADMLDEPCVTT